MDVARRLGLYIKVKRKVLEIASNCCDNAHPIFWVGIMVGHVFISCISSSSPLLELATISLLFSLSIIERHLASSVIFSVSIIRLFLFEILLLMSFSFLQFL